MTPGRKKSAAKKKLAAIRKKAAATKKASRGSRAKEPVAEEKKSAPRNHASNNVSPEFEANKWKPGQSGNPAGRPKGKTFEQKLDDYLDGLVPDDPEGRSRLDAMVEVVFSEGVTRRNSKVMIALLDRLYPKPLRIIGDPASPIIVEATTTVVGVDYSRLSQVERKALLRLQEKAMDDVGESAG